MGNNTSFGRSREETHGSRDVRRVTENEQARPTKIKCLNSATHYSYIYTTVLHSVSSLAHFNDTSLGPTIFFQTYTIRQLDLMPKFWNELLRHWRSGWMSNALSQEVLAGNGFWHEIATYRSFIWQSIICRQEAAYRHIILLALIISNVSEEVASQIAKNCRCRQRHSHLKSPPRWISANICNSAIHLIFPETRVIH